MKQWNLSAGLWHYWQLTLSFVVLLLLCVLTSVASYFSAKESTWSMLRRSNQLFLESAMHSIEGDLSQIERFSASLAKLDTVRSFMRNERLGSPALVDSVMKDMMTIPRYDSPVLFDYYLYNPKSNVSIAPGRGFLPMDRYYEYEFQWDDLTFDQWRSSLSTEYLSGVFLPVQTIVHKKTARSALIYTKSVLSVKDRSLDTGGYIVFLLDREKINRTLNVMLENGAESVFVLDKDGACVSSLDTGADGAYQYDFADFTERSGSFLVDRGRIVYYMRSEESGRVYGVSIPEQVVKSQVAAILRSMAVCVSVIIAVGILVTVLLVRRNRRPLIQLSRQLASKGVSTPETYDMSGLARSVDELITGKEALELMIHEQDALLKNALLNRLIAGEAHRRSEWAGLMRQVGIVDEGGRYQGVYMRLLLESRSDPMHDAIRQADVLALFSAYAGAFPLVTPMNAGHYGLLFQSAEEDCEELCERIHAEIRERHGEAAEFFIGPAYDDPEKIHLSFAGARRLLDAHDDTVHQYIVSAGSDTQNSCGYVYAIQEEQRLLGLLSRGSVDTINGELDRIYEENFVHRSLSPLARTMLFHRLLGTLIEYDGSHTFRFDVERMEPQFPATRFFETLKAEYALLCHNIAAKKQNDLDQLSQEISDYIRGNYKNRELSLRLIAERFRLSESRLSILIKNAIGDTFSTLVERLRIEHANGLLAESKLSIELIAEEVGYANVHSFRRAYKRYMGASPSRYRESGTGGKQ